MPEFAQNQIRYLNESITRIRLVGILEMPTHNRFPSELRSISRICDPPEVAAKVRLRANNRWDVLLGSRDPPRFPYQAHFSKRRVVMGAGQTQAVTANQLKHFADRLTEPQVFQLTTRALGSPKFRPVIPTRIGEGESHSQAIQ